MNWKVVIPMFAAVFAVETANLVGGPMDVDVNDRGVQEALQFAVVQHNKQTNDMFVRRVAEVTRAQSQVVAGMKYTLTVQMGRTPCRKGGAETVCEIHEDPQKALPYQCKFVVWSRPWLGLIEMVEQTCQ
ncbi:cystatin C (amyloid angiopathy and cerebral hemorrhage) [Polymixia lowei]